MKRILTILMFGILSISAQTNFVETKLVFEATHYFEGIIYQGEIMWAPTVPVVKQKKITLKGNHCTIKNNTYYFDIVDEISENTYEDHNEYVWNVKDKDNRSCIITILQYEHYVQIYFEYKKDIYGYHMVLKRAKK